MATQNMTKHNIIPQECYDALESNDLNSLDFLQENHAIILRVCSKGKTPLHIFLKEYADYQDKMHQNLFNRLVKDLKTNDNVDLQDDEDKTPLHIYFSKWTNPTQGVNHLSSSQNIDMQDENGKTPVHLFLDNLHSLISNGLTEVEVRVILDVIVSPRNINIYDRERCLPIHIILKRCLEESKTIIPNFVFEYLISNSNRNSTDKHSCAPIHYLLAGAAVNRFSFSQIKSFVTDENLNMEGCLEPDTSETPLHILVSRHALQDIPYLYLSVIVTKNNIDLANHEGRTPLMCALKKQEKQKMEIMTACSDVRSKFFRNLELLISPRNVDMHMKKGQCPIHVFLSKFLDPMWQKNTDQVIGLIGKLTSRYNKKLVDTSFGNYTPLHSILNTSIGDIPLQAVSLLITKSNIKKPDKFSRIPFAITVSKPVYLNPNRLAVLRALLPSNPRYMNMRNSNGNTLLMEVAGSPYTAKIEGLVELMISNGATCFPYNVRTNQYALQLYISSLVFGGYVNLLSNKTLDLLATNSQDYQGEPESYYQNALYQMLLATFRDIYEFGVNETSYCTLTVLLRHIPYGKVKYMSIKRSSEQMCKSFSNLRCLLQNVGLIRGLDNSTVTMKPCKSPTSCWEECKCPDPDIHLSSQRTMTPFSLEYHSIWAIRERMPCRSLEQYGKIPVPSLITRKITLEVLVDELCTLCLCPKFCKKTY